MQYREEIIMSSVKVLLLAVPETAGSVLYGMLDVLSATGNIWQTLVRSDALPAQFKPQILTLNKKPFNCGNGIPIRSDVTVKENPSTDILIIPELWLGPDEKITGKYTEIIDFIKRKHAEGTFIYSACSGALMLAESGLLDGNQATSHWGYMDLFRQSYPSVKFQPNANLCFADDDGRIVTAGGTTSWHDLIIHIISRHCSPGEALRIAKVYLLKLHNEGQLPYTPLIRNLHHKDSKVFEAEKWLKTNFRNKEAIENLLKVINIPSRTIKRRFKKATGQSLIDRVQCLRIEEAKHKFETQTISIDDVSAEVGYEDPAFFRRLFKRLTGMTPSSYKKMFNQTNF